MQKIVWTVERFPYWGRYIENTTNYLKHGWEPFAVSSSDEGDYIWLRKMVDNA